VTFSPSSFFATGKRPEEQAEGTEKRPVSRPESKPESLENSVLDLLKQGPSSKVELSQALVHKHISGALKKALASLLKQEKIAHTIPVEPIADCKNINLNDRFVKLRCTVGGSFPVFDIAIFLHNFFFLSL
jgi:hypothetical protein